MIKILSLADMDRAALRKLYREALGVPSDRTILDRSKDMRADLTAALAQVEGCQISSEEVEAEQMEMAFTAQAGVEVHVEEVEQLPEVVLPAPEVIAPVEIIILEAAEEAPAQDTAPAPQIAQEEVEAEKKGSKWITIVGNLWALREGEEAMEVKIPVEKMIEMGLPHYSTARGVNWTKNQPPGKAAREMGFYTTLSQKDGKPSYLLIRKL